VSSDQVDADNLTFLTRQLARRGWLGAGLVGDAAAIEWEFGTIGKPS
jgi:hypothetical protein